MEGKINIRFWILWPNEGKFLQKMMILQWAETHKFLSNIIAKYTAKCCACFTNDLANNNNNKKVLICSTTSSVIIEEA